MISQSPRSGNPGRRIPQPDDRRTDMPLRSVIVTPSGVGSYDHLFQQVPQSVPNGRVSGWHVGPGQFDALAAALSPSEGRARVADAALARDLEELRAELAQVPAENVVVNWECCSDWGTAWPDRA